MSINSPKSLVLKFFTNTSGSYDKVVHWATFGRDGIWKKEILNKICGKSILDLACGTGILTRKIAQRFPYADVIGVDMSTSYLDVARLRAEKVFIDLRKNEKCLFGVVFEPVAFIPVFRNPQFYERHLVALWEGV